MLTRTIGAVSTTFQPASPYARRGQEISTQGRCSRIVPCAGKRKIVFSNTFVKKRGMGGLKLVDTAEPTTGTDVSASATVSVPKGNTPPAKGSEQPVIYHGMHHVGLLCENLEKSLEFYIGVLGLEVNPDRPDDKLPYRGAWLWIGPEMIHLMELPNPDPLHGRPEHGGRDRHFCVGVKDIVPLQEKLDMAGVEYTKSMSGRQALFFRDPDMNCLEIVEMASGWR